MKCRMATKTTVWNAGCGAGSAMSELRRQCTSCPLPKACWSAWRIARWLLVMDGSTVGRGCMALLVGVVYQRRVLPLAWVVYKGKKGHAPASRHLEVLELVQPLIPAESTVILLGDGEYDNPEMLTWVSTQTTWFFASRTASTTLVSTTPDE